MVGEAGLASQPADLRLSEIPQGEQAAAQLLLRQGVQEIGLVLAPIKAFQSYNFV